MSEHDYGRLSDDEMRREWRAAAKRAAREQAEIDAAAAKARDALAEQDDTEK